MLPAGPNARAAVAAGGRGSRRHAAFWPEIVYRLPVREQHPGTSGGREARGPHRWRAQAERAGHGPARAVAGPRGEQFGGTARPRGQQRRLAGRRAGQPQHLHLPAGLGRGQGGARPAATPRPHRRRCRPRPGAVQAAPSTGSPDGEKETAVSVAGEHRRLAGAAARACTLVSGVQAAAPGPACVDPAAGEQGEQAAAARRRGQGVRDVGEAGRPARRATTVRRCPSSSPAARSPGSWLGRKPGDERTASAQGPARPGRRCWPRRAG